MGQPCASHAVGQGAGRASTSFGPVAEEAAEMEDWIKDCGRRDKWAGPQIVWVTICNKRLSSNVRQQMSEFRNRHERMNRTR